MTPPSPQVVTTTTSTSPSLSEAPHMTTTSLSGQLPDPARIKYDELLLSLLVERFGRISTSLPRAVTTDAATVLRDLRRERTGRRTAERTKRTPRRTP